MTTSPLPSLHKALLVLSLVAALLLLCALGRRRLEASKARSGLLVEILANVSKGLDHLEAGLEDVSKRASAAKARLQRLVATRKQNLLAYALLRLRGQSRGTRRPRRSRSSTINTEGSFNRP